MEASQDNIIRLIRGIQAEMLGTVTQMDLSKRSNGQYLHEVISKIIMAKDRVINFNEQIMQTECFIRFEKNS